MNQFRRMHIMVLAIAAILPLVALQAADLKVSGSATYSATGPTGSWKGTNGSISGTVSPDGSSGKVCMDMKKWDSKNTRRDNHTNDMLEVDKFPQACFTWNQVSGSGSQKTLKGTMDLHGVQKPATFTGTLSKNGGKVTFNGSGTILVEDHGMKRPSLMGMKVQNEVKIEIQAQGGN